MKLNLKPKINLKGKGRKYFRFVHLLGILALGGVGGAIAYLGNSDGNPLLIVVGFVGMAGSFLLFMRWRNSGETRILVEKGEEEGVAKMPPNCLVISPDLIAFKNVLNPPGQSQKCYNDGKFYHVLCDEKKAREYQEFVLPDDDEKERYYDPQEFANPVTMPSNKKYFTWSASLMQQISVGVLALVVGGLLVALIVLGGS